MWRPLQIRMIILDTSPFLLKNSDQHISAHPRHMHCHLPETERNNNVRACCCFGRMRLKCDGTRTETRFRLSAKWTSTFKSAGASVQSTTGSRCVRISGSNAGYPMFRGSVKSTGYPLHPPVSTSLPVRHRVPSYFNCSLRDANVKNPHPTSPITWSHITYPAFWRVATWLRVLSSGGFVSNE